MRDNKTSSRDIDICQNKSHYTIISMTIKNGVKMCTYQAFTFSFVHMIQVKNPSSIFNILRMTDS